MILRFATKNNINGNHNILVIDTDAKECASCASGFFHRSDFVTVGARDLQKIKKELLKDDYRIVNCIG